MVTLRFTDDEITHTRLDIQLVQSKPAHHAYNIELPAN
jgi:hypothetical protein